MGLIEDSYERYTSETGDSPPIRPKRLWRKRFPQWIPTKAGQQYFDECDKYQMRYLDWLYRTIKGGPVLG